MNIQLIELISASKIFYVGDKEERKCFHYELSYTATVGGVEMRVEFNPTTDEALKEFPFLPEVIEERSENVMDIALLSIL